MPSYQRIKAALAAQRARERESSGPLDSSLATWRSELDELVDAHGSELANRGMEYVTSITGMHYVPSKRHIACVCQGSRQKPYFVSICIDDPSDDMDYWLDASCSCPYSDGEILCKHTYAAATVLKREFFGRGLESPLVRSILGEAEADWKAALRQLDEFLKRPAKDRDDSPAKSQARLVWRIITRPSSSPYSSPITVDPVEQTPKTTRGGGWNRGRVMRWNDLARRKDGLATPADLTVIRATPISMYQYEPLSDQWSTILDALVGHPLVFYENRPITIRRGMLGMCLRDQQAAWQLTSSLDGRSLMEFSFVAILDDNHLAAIDGDASVLVLATAKSDLLKFVASLMNNTPRIPKEGQAEFLSRLPALEELVPVTLPESLKGELVEAITDLTLRIHPGELTGAHLELRITPAPAGTAFVPGQGPMEVSGKQGGERVRVERDLDDERRRGTTLANELLLARFDSPEPFAWQLATDDDVLDVLDSIRQRPENDPLVVWPEDQKVRRMSVLGEIAPASLKVEIKDQHDWFGLSGAIELGGETIPLATLLAALREGRRYIPLGKGHFASITKAFRDRLASVADMLHSNRGKLEFNTTAAPVIADLLDEQITLKSSKKWKESLTRLNRSIDLDPHLPTTLTADLRDYQVDGFKWLRRLAEWGVGGILADDMGLGKTVQALAVLLDRREAGPILVVAPVSVGFNWVREAERFAPTLAPMLYRDTDRKEFLASLGHGDMLITSYHLLLQHVDDLAGVRWGTLVLDEAQAIKNSQTKTAQAVRKLDADWRFALTGTPCENHLGDLWSIFRAVSPGLFGSWERFREVFANPIEKGKSTERKGALARVLRPFVLRRSKSEVLTELPPRTEVQLTAELSDAERRRYEDARLSAIAQLADVASETGKDKRFQVLAALTKLRQLSCHPRLVDAEWKHSSAKLDLFLETVDELRDGNHRALVFSQFTSHLALVREALDARQITYQYLDGHTPPAKRRERVDAFQRGEGELFLISLKAGGTGLNLTGADYVIHLDPWWNPAVEDQASDRAHRIGQTRPVTVYRLVAKDTIEEQILKLHADKRDLVASILDGTDQAAKLSTRELIDLIALGSRRT